MSPAARGTWRQTAASEGTSRPEAAAGRGHSLSGEGASPAPAASPVRPPPQPSQLLPVVMALVYLDDVALAVRFPCKCG